MNNIELSPSLLSSDFSNFSSAVDKINNSGAQCIHFDVMDGHFVPPITFGAKAVQDIRKESELYFDVHIMVTHPEQKVTDFANAGSNSLTFHFETTDHPFTIIDSIHDKGMDAGISLVPSTPTEVLREIIPFVETVLIMGVSPGFGGQDMLKGTINRLVEIRKLKDRLNPNLCIAVDGGVNLETSKACLEAGATRLISGSAFFNAEDPAEFTRKILGVS